MSKLNPNAKTFSFNPSATSYVPPFQAPAAQPAPDQPAEPAPAAESDQSPVSHAFDKWDQDDKETEQVTEKVADLSVAEPEKPQPTQEETKEPETKEPEAKEPESAEPAESAEPTESEASADIFPSRNFDPYSLKPHDERDHLNIVFIGHVDAGKSTISGQILLQTGQVDKRTIEKYEKEAKEKNRESWYIAFIMDTNEEERARGKTVEVGRAHFDTSTKRYTVLDAPGHKNYVPNMIGGAAQADVGVLVISARRGEFETGFERGGQTREHAMLSKTLGIQRLIVFINKMDDPTVQWEQARYDEIVDKLTPFLKKWGYQPEKDLFFIPGSGLTGQNVMIPLADGVCTWFKNPRSSLLQLLDTIKPVDRDARGPLRIPLITRYKDMGILHALGKVESGTIAKDTKLLIMPTKKEVYCSGIIIDEQDVECARAGENVTIKFKGAEEEDLQTGFVMSYSDRPCKRSKIFDAQVMVLDLMEHKPLMTAGYSCVLHLHTLAVECQVKTLLVEYDKKTNKKLPKRPKFFKSQAMGEIRLETDDTVAIEEFKDFPQMGRFTLRDEGQTIAVGKITKVYEGK